MNNFKRIAHEIVHECLLDARGLRAPVQEDNETGRNTFPLAGGNFAIVNASLLVQIRTIRRNLAIQIVCLLNLRPRNSTILAVSNGPSASASMPAE